MFSVSGNSRWASLSSLLSARDRLHSPLPTARPNLTSRQPTALLARAPESCPGPDPDSRYRCVWIIPKHLQNVTVFLFGTPSYFIRDHPIAIGGMI